jgi:hypothetical protein
LEAKPQRLTSLNTAGQSRRSWDSACERNKGEEEGSVCGCSGGVTGGR